MEIEKLREKLQSPLPPESISQHPTKKFLSSIKAIYVTERMNEVFGLGKWTTKVEHVATQEKAKGSKVGDMVVVKLILEVPEYNIYYEAYGGNDNADLGDAYKGAMTDALTKIGSFMEIGIDVFKGKGSTPQVGTKSTSGNVCSTCGATPAMSYKKDPKGVEYCPNLCWKKDKGNKIISKKEYENTKEFEKDMPDETIEYPPE